MSDKFSNSWDERYSREEYVYGIQPNEYLKEQLQKFQQGKILFAAEGEQLNVCDKAYEPLTLIVRTPVALS